MNQDQIKEWVTKQVMALEKEGGVAELHLLDSNTKLSSRLLKMSSLIYMRGRSDAFVEVIDKLEGR